MVRARESALLFIELQIQDNIFATIKTGDRARLRFGSVLFGVEFVIGIGIQTAKAVISGIVADVAAHGIGTHILQENNAGGDRGVALVDDHATNGAQFGFVLRILRSTSADSQACEDE